MKKIYLLLLLFAAFKGSAQTLVNLAWKDTTGHPSININHQSFVKDGSYLFVAGTSYNLGVGDKFYVEKVNFYGAVQWYEEYNVPSYNSIVATDLYIKGSYLYLAGVLSILLTTALNMLQSN